jgi:hypothetical protein
MDSLFIYLREKIMNELETNNQQLNKPNITDSQKVYKQPSVVHYGNIAVLTKGASGPDDDFPGSRDDG